MGSGISITEKQAIGIVKRELADLFQQTEKSKRLVGDDGVLLYENFDHEEEYNKKLKRLRQMEAWIQPYQNVSFKSKISG
jgi:hypothetical protein